MLRLIYVLLVLLLLATGCASAADTRTLGVQADSGKRIALVIGNDQYQKVEPLKNARADARAIAKALEQAGFSVTLRHDLTERGVKEAVRRFKSQISGGDEAVFFFAGHGVQLGGANYLLPVDIAGESEDQVKDEALPLQRVLDDMQEQKARFALAIIDACRNNPFKGGARSLGGRGLAPTSAATGQMVLFSAGTNQQALDTLGPGDRDPNGLFTRVLLKQMPQPGVSVDRVLRTVRDEVVRLARAVGHEQVPALYDQAIGDFYFHAPQAGSPAPSPAAGVDAAALELAFWESAARGHSAPDYLAYINKYPEGQFLELARSRLKQLKGGRPAAEHRRDDAIATPPELKVGDSWRYRGRNDAGTDTPTYQVDRVTDEGVEMSYETNKRERVWMLLNASLNPVEIRGLSGAVNMKYDPYASILEFPLHPGKKWQGAYKSDCGSLCSFDMEHEGEVKGWEKVTTPAGTFEALRIENRETYHYMLGITQHGVRRTWLAPELKQAVKFDYIFNGKTLYEYELEDYRLTE